MAQKITKKLIEQTEPYEEGLRWLYDDELPGFSVRITPNGAKSYVLIYTVNGQQRRMTLGQFPGIKIGAAREAAQKLRVKINLGEDPLGEKHSRRKAETLKDVCREYAEGELLKKRPNTQADFKYMIDKIVVPRLGSRKIKSITKADVKRLHRAVTEKNGPYRANRIVSIMSILLNEAEDAGYIPTNPIRGKKKWLNHEGKRQRFLSQKEIHRLSAVLAEFPNQTVANIIRLLLLTGCRKSEALSATWDQVDFETGRWTKPSSETKQKTEHVVPLSAPALQLLQELQETAEDDLVFHGKYRGQPFKGLTWAWYRIREQAGLDDVRIHDLRHTYASILVSSGASLPMIGRLLGHSQPVTTQRYAHLHDEPLRELSERVGKVVAPPASESEPAKVVPLRGDMN